MFDARNADEGSTAQTIPRWLLRRKPGKRKSRGSVERAQEHPDIDKLAAQKPDIVMLQGVRKGELTAEAWIHTKHV